MLKRLNLTLLAIIIVVLVTGCGEKETKETTSPLTTEGTSSKSETKGKEASKDEVEYLKLGETGQLIGKVGQFEITINSAIGKTSLEQIDLDRDLFIILNATIKNIGEETQEFETHFGPGKLMLFNADERPVSARNRNWNILNDSIEEIKPGEMIQGDILFDHRESEYYVLQFGFGLSESLSNRLNWKINFDEIQHE